MKYFIIILIMLLAPIVSADWLGTWDIDEYLPIHISTSQFSTGALLTTANAQYSIFEETNGTFSVTEVVGPTALTMDFSGETGLHVGSVQLSAANTFEAGKSYVVWIEATVDSVVAGTSHGFRIRAEPVAIASAQLTASDNIGINWGDVSNPTTSVGLTNTTVGTTSAITGLTIANGAVDAKLTYIMDTVLTETAGQLAGSFIKFFDVAAPTATALSLPDAVPGAAGGGFIAGTNAATVVTTSFTTVFTGDLTGGVGSVSGNVGGDVQGNVDGTVAGKTPAEASDVTTAHSTTDTLITNRSLAAADYFLFGSDPVAVVTLVNGLNTDVVSAAAVADAAWQELIELFFTFDATATYGTQAGSVVDQIADNAGVATAVNTTVAAQTSGTIFTITAGSQLADAYNDMQITVTDAGGEQSTETRRISDYAVTTRQVTVDRTFSFTPAAGDIAVIERAYLGVAVSGGDATEAKQDTMITDLEAIMSKAADDPSVGTYNVATDSLEAQQENPQGPPIID